MSSVIVKIINNAGSQLADPYVSVIGNGVNFYITKAGACSQTDNGGKTSIKCSELSSAQLSFDSTDAIAGGRIYFSSQSTPAPPGGFDVATSDFYLDWVEFSLNSGTSNQLVVNTTQVDQFGFPIQIEVNPPDENFGATAGTLLDRQTLIRDFQSLPAGYQDCLYPVPGSSGEWYRILSPNMAIVKHPSSDLTGTFTSEIDQFFTQYSTKALYLDSDSAYPYQGRVTTVSEKDKSGKAHDYTVIQFNFAPDAPINPGIDNPPKSGSGPYNIYYPFFQENNPSGHSAPAGIEIHPAPAWWYDSIVAGDLNVNENPSQMIFAGNGVFADTFWQLGITTTESPTPQAMVLGNLENQIDVAFQRGHARSWFTLAGSIAPSGAADPTTGLHTSTVTLKAQAYGAQNTPNTTANIEVGMQCISIAASIPLQVAKILSDTTFTVTSSLPILALNTLYLTFANFYPQGGTFNEYGKFFHQDTVSIGGRAYALSFDDQGGFSATLTSNWTSTPSTLTITLGPWAPKS